MSWPIHLSDAAIALLQDAPPRSPENWTQLAGDRAADDFTDPNYSWSNEAAVDGELAVGPARPADAVGAADQANRPIICEYKPDALWLWSQYRGTVLSITIVPVLLTVSLALGSTPRRTRPPRSRGASPRSRRRITR